jgi:hypothetical protein
MNKIKLGKMDNFQKVDCYVHVTSPRIFSSYFNCDTLCLYACIPCTGDEAASFTPGYVRSHEITWKSRLLEYCDSWIRHFCTMYIMSELPNPNSRNLPAIQQNPGTHSIARVPWLIPQMRVLKHVQKFRTSGTN